MKILRNHKLMLIAVACAIAMLFQLVIPSFAFAAAEGREIASLQSAENKGEGPSITYTYTYAEGELPTPDEIEGWVFDAWYTQPVTYHFWGSNALTYAPGNEKVTTPPSEWQDAIEFESYSKSYVEPEEDSIEANYNLTEDQMIWKEFYYRWLSKSDGERVVDTSKLNSGDTLYARFVPKSYSVKVYYVGYNGLKGVLNCIRPYGSPLSLEVSSVEGVVADGWYDKPVGGNQILPALYLKDLLDYYKVDHMDNDEYQSDKTVTKDMTVFLQWHYADSPASSGSTAFASANDSVYLKYYDDDAMAKYLVEQEQKRLAAEEEQKKLAEEEERKRAEEAEYKSPDHVCHDLYLVVGKAPTCTEAGLMSYFACKCGKIYKDINGVYPTTLSELILSPRHSLILIKSKAPTCTEAGYSAYYKCTGCNELFSDNGGNDQIESIEDIKIDISHNWKTEYSFDGENHYHICADCGTHDVDIPHNYNVDSATESIDKHCNDCGYVAESVKPHVHNMTYVAYKAPTCTANGNIAYAHCTTCDKYFADNGNRTLSAKEIMFSDTVISAKGHSPRKVEAADATCTTVGNIEYYHCDTCNADFADMDCLEEVDNTVIEMTDHVWSFERDRENHYNVCLKCGEIKDCEAHNYNVSDADENTDKYCLKCNYVAELRKEPQTAEPEVKENDVIEPENEILPEVQPETEVKEPEVKNEVTEPEAQPDVQNEVIEPEAQPDVQNEVTEPEAQPEVKNEVIKPEAQPEVKNEVTEPEVIEPEAKEPIPHSAKSEAAEIDNAAPETEMLSETAASGVVTSDKASDSSGKIGLYIGLSSAAALVAAGVAVMIVRKKRNSK